MNELFKRCGLPNVPGWELLPLAEVAAAAPHSFIDGPFGSDLKVSDYTQTGVRILQLQNLGDGVFLDSNKKYTSQAKANQLSRCITRPGDIIIAKMAEPLARAAVVPSNNDKYLIVADLIKLVPGGDCDKYFIVSSINSSTFRMEAVRRSTGTTRTRISLSTLKQIPVNLPPLPEQRKIASILTTVDRLIEQTEALIEKYRRVKQGMMADLLSRGVDEHGKLRPTQKKAPELYKQSELGWIPKEWECERLDDVANRGSGHTPDKSKPSYWNGNVKWVSLADSAKLDQIYIHDTEKKISEKGLANSSAVRHPPHTVIVTRDGQRLGKSAIISTTMAVSQHFMAWQCGRRMNHTYLYFWLQNEKPQFAAIAMGSTIMTIGLPFFRKLQIAVPPRHEQDVAVNGLLSIERKLDCLLDELKKLRTLKTGLMQDLLTGKVRVKVDQDEEATANV